MAQYDGSIRINTDIEVKQAEKELKTLESNISKTANKIASLRSKMDALKDVKIPTQEYTEVQKQIEITEKKINDLLARQEKFLATGGKESSSTYQRMQYDLEELQNSLPYLQSELQSLVDTGKAFTLGQDTEKYAEMSAQIQALNQQMQSDTERQAELQSQIAEREERLAQIRENAVVGNQRIIKTLERIKQLEQEIADLKSAGITEGYSDYDNRIQELSALKQEVKDYKNNIGQVKESYKKLGDTAKQSFEKINNTQKKSIGLLGSFGKQLKSIIAATFIFNTIRKAFNSLIKGIKEGFENLYEQNEKFKSSVDNLKASSLTLKNALASAFAPLVEIAIPYIQRFVEWLTKAVNLVGQFIAALTGRKTYTRAIKQTAKASDDAAKATKKEADAMEEAQEAAEGYLSPLDEINKYREEEIKSPKTKKEDEIEEPEAGVENMFEEIPIDNRILDFLQKLKDLLKPIIDYAKKLKDIFMQGFFDGLGDWEYRWESIKDSIASIKDSLIDIFTDPAVLVAADKWAQSVAYMLGSLAGSMASVGLTIATNLLGGLAKYLEQNKERIKKYLVSMFDIWSEVNYMLADFFQSFAYVFEAFASEDGQRLTANLIGIFVDAFMGATELASKLIRDILNIFIQPFVDNREELRTALEGFLGVLADVAGTIKDGIDATFDKLNEVYDKHFKPFFDSIANGLSNLLKKFLDFWNGKVQPMLKQMAKEFDDLWKTHLQPLIDNFIELLGKVADLLKALWENILQPFIAWVIDNILPKILPVIKAIWDTLVDFVAYIADAISAIITIIGGIIDFLTGVFSGDWDLAFQGLTDVVQGFVDGIKIIVSGIVEIGKDIILGLMEGIAAVASGIFQFIKEIIVEPLINAFKSLFGIHSPSTVMAELGKYLIEGLLNGIKSLVPNVQEIWDSMKQAAVDAWNSAKETLVNIWESTKETAIQTWESIKQSLSDKWENLKTSAKDTFNNIREKVKESWTGIKENVKESAENVKTNITNAWTKAKESTSTAWNNMKSSVASKIQSMASSIREKFGSIRNTISSFGSSAQSLWASAWEGMRNKVTSILSSIKSTISSVFSWISSTIGSLGNSLRSLTSSLFSFGSTKTMISGNTSSRYSRAAMPTSLYSSPAFAAMNSMEIPKLATGAVIPANREFLAVLGDQKHGTNVEAPLDMIKQASEEGILNVLSKIGFSGGNMGGTPVNLTLQVLLDGAVIGQKMIDWGKLQQMATGSNPYGLGTT